MLRLAAVLHAALLLSRPCSFLPLAHSQTSPTAHPPPQVVCDPAKIVLAKSAGGCTHKYTTPSSWKGKVSRGEVDAACALRQVCLLRSRCRTALYEPPASGSLATVRPRPPALSTWLLQECKISGGAGFSKSWVQGGGAYSIPLKTVSIGYEP